MDGDGVDDEGGGGGDGVDDDDDTDDDGGDNDGGYCDDVSDDGDPLSSYATDTLPFIKTEKAGCGQQIVVGGEERQVTACALISVFSILYLIKSSILIGEAHTELLGISYQ